MKDLRIDEKGKFFTTHVSKRMVKVATATQGNIFRGTMHLMLDNRLKDEMNNGERFLAMTDVQVYALDGTTPIYSAPAVVLNKEQIVWVIPQGNDDDGSASDN